MQALPKPLTAPKLERNPLWLNPLRVPSVLQIMSMGYAHHVMNDPSRRRTQSQKRARQILRRYDRLRAEPGTPEENYLLTAQAISLSFGEGLSRRKREWVEALAEAKQVRDLEETNIRKARSRSAGIGVLRPLMMPIIIGIAAAAATWIAGGYVPETVTERTGSGVGFTVFIGLAVGWATRQAGEWYKQRTLRQVLLVYQLYCSEATKLYKEAKIEEFSIFFAQACQLWQEYTGKVAPTTITYEDVMAGDLIEVGVRHSRYVEEAKGILAHVRACVPLVKGWAKNCIRWRRNNTTPPEGEVTPVG